MSLALVSKGGPGSGTSEDNTAEIVMPHSDFTSVGTRKGMLDNMEFKRERVKMSDITHVGQEKYVPKKLKAMIKDWDKVKEKPIDLLKVGKEYHVMDGHHRYLAAKKLGEKEINAKVRTKADVEKSQPTSSDVHVPTAGSEHDKKNLKQLETSFDRFIDEESVEKDKLTTEGRKHIAGTNFALPKTRQYPIHDIAHARNALARVAQHGSEADQKAVRRAVYSKYPSLDKLEKGAGGPEKYSQEDDQVADEETVGEDQMTIAPGDAEPRLPDPEANAEMSPQIDNLEAEILKAVLAGSDDNPTAGLYDMQELVSGTDWEIEMDNSPTDQAKEVALENLYQDPDYYRKKRLERDGTSDELEKNMGENDENDELDDFDRGLWIDLGSGNCREDGHLGFDLFPYDHGTVVHDLHQGIPLPDASVSKVVLKNSLHEMDELSDDPKPLLSDIQRVLMPEGEFVYEGPNQIYNEQEWRENYPGLTLTDSRDNNVEKKKGELYHHVFTRVASPDPATENDAEPRIGVSQYDQLPSDALLAMDALGYYYSDATSSGKGNRAMGYPSQGAIVGKSDVSLVQKAKSGKEADASVALREHAQGLLNEARFRNITETEIRGLSSEYLKNLEAYAGFQMGELSKDLLKKCNDKLKEAIKSINYELAGSPNEFEGPGRAKSADSTSVVYKSVPICKRDDDRQIVYGVVLAPSEIDSQEDFMEPLDIEEAAHNYMMKSRVVGDSHDKPMQAQPIESYIAPQDLEMTGQYGPQSVKKGSWVLGVKINSPEDWDKVKSGEYTGFSVGGYGQRDEM